MTLCSMCIVRILSFNEIALRKILVVVKKLLENAVFVSVSDVFYGRTTFTTVQASPHVDKKARDQFVKQHVYVVIRVTASENLLVHLRRFLNATGCETHVQWNN